MCNWYEEGLGELIHSDYASDGSVNYEIYSRRNEKGKWEYAVVVDLWGTESVVYLRKGKVIDCYVDQ